MPTDEAEVSDQIGRASDLLDLTTVLLNQSIAPRGVHQDERYYADRAALVNRARESFRVRALAVCRKNAIRLLVSDQKLPIPLRCYEIARGLDQCEGGAFLECFKRRADRNGGILEIRAGDPYPAFAAPVEALIDSNKLFARPEKISPEEIELTHLRIRSKDFNAVRVRYDFRFFNSLVLPKSTLSIATAMVNSDINELSLDYPDVGGRRKFRVIGPTDELDQQRRLGSAVRLAGDHACVVVLPELCTSEDGILKSERTLCESTHGMLLVAGSMHRRNGKGFVNECPVRVRNNTQTTKHRKFSKFWITDNGEEVHEHIRKASRTVTVIVNQHWSFVVLICKDFLDRQVDGVLGELRIPLVLLPAMTFDVDTFRACAEGIVVRTRGLIVLANNGFRATGHSASNPGFVCGPVKKAPILVPLTDASTPVPSVYLYDIRHQTARLLS